jgi:hypothetical protein
MLGFQGKMGRDGRKVSDNVQHGDIERMRK